MKAIIRYLYNASWYGAMPWLWLRLKLLAHLRHKGYEEAILERFGRYPPLAGARSSYWVHAVSVGETKAAEPLIAELRSQFPRQPIVLTQMTPTGRSVARSRWAHEPEIQLAWAPYDAPRWVAAAFERFRARVLVLLETELWPNWLQVAQARAIPVLIANGRLSPDSFRRYQKLTRYFPIAWDAIRCVAAQSAEDGERFAALGIEQIEVVGNLKFDCAVDSELVARGKSWRSRWQSGRPVVVLASSRAGEEALWLRAWQETAPALAIKPLWVIVPRHPERADAVWDLLRAAGLRGARRSKALPQPEDDFWLGDSLGELTAYYAMGDVALIGGSWLAFGGHNPLEAMSVETPVIIGPYTENFAALVAAARKEGAIWQVASITEGINAALSLIAEPARRAQQIHRANAFLATHRGATARTLALFSAYL